MKPVIEIKNISKAYNISHQLKPKYKSLRDEFTDFFHRPFKKLTGQADQVEKFWALKDVNFNVNQGEVLGIIGRNGSGKSTLLKILSRIVEPSGGEVIMRGKVASLLEVGTGFHPELTGRENIYFNGSILGMSKREIEAKFNDIVEFSEIEKFLDTPVKFYSSGMYVRLAFAVAAHLEPDILIVDEVLAVGDAAFQKKCLGKMSTVAEEGRTVVFVSHSMASIEKLCSKAILLEGGKVAAQGNIKEVVHSYLATQGLVTDKVLSSEWTNTGKVDSNYFTPKSLKLLSPSGKPLKGTASKDKSILVEITGIIKKLDPLLTIGIACSNEEGNALFWSYPTDENDKRQMSLGKFKFTAEIPPHLLNEGIYKIELIGGLHFKEWLLEPENAPFVYLEIKGNLSNSSLWQDRRPGDFGPILKWRSNDF